MTITLYFTEGSPPARACLFLLRHLKLDVEIKKVDLFNKEHHGEKFSKLNPAQKVPVLVDGDFVLTESRAILAYLVNSKKAGSDLYPSDPKGRALVDQRLYYDATNVFEKLATLVRPGIFGGVKTVDQKHKDDVKSVLKVLNTFLDGEEYFAGSKLTIADISILTTITSFYEMGYNLSEYENLNRWYSKMQKLPGFDENESGAKALAGVMKVVYPGETMY